MPATPCSTTIYTCAAIYDYLRGIHAPESWVEVKPQQQEGALTHSHSIEQMEELLASAVAEKEEGGQQPTL